MGLNRPVPKRRASCSIAVRTSCSTPAGSNARILFSTMSATWVITVLSRRPRASGTRLEYNLCRELQDSRVQSGSNLAEEGGIAEPRVGIASQVEIGKIEGLGANFQADTFPDRKDSRQAGIDFEHSWTE